MPRNAAPATSGQDKQTVAANAADPAGGMGNLGKGRARERARMAGLYQSCLYGRSYGAI